MQTSVTQESTATKSKAAPLSLYLDQFSAYLAALGKSQATILSYGRDAHSFLNYLYSQGGIPLTSVTTQIIQGYLQEKKDKSLDRPNSIRRSIIGIKQFFRFLIHEKIMTTNPFDYVVIPQRLETSAMPLTNEQVDIILTSNQSTSLFKQARDRFLMSLLAFDGLKTTEVINLIWEDILASHDTCYLKIRYQKSRLIKLSAKTVTHLHHYESLWDENFSNLSLPEKNLRSIFVGFKGKTAGLVINSLTRHGLKFALYELGNQANLSHLNAETLRHFAIKHLLNQGLSPSNIMTQLGLRRVGVISQHLK